MCHLQDKEMSMYQNVKRFLTILYFLLMDNSLASIWQLLMPYFIGSYVHDENWATV